MSYINRVPAAEVISKKFNIPLTDVFNVLIIDVPTAAVVPTSEVERLKDEALEIGYEIGKTEVAKEIFAEIEENISNAEKELCEEFEFEEKWGAEEAFGIICANITKLKKKYTEGGEGE